MEVAVPTEYIEKLMSLMRGMLDSAVGLTVGGLEKMLGMLQHAATLLTRLRQHMKRCYGLLATYLAREGARLQGHPFWRRVV